MKPIVVAVDEHVALRTNLFRLRELDPLALSLTAVHDGRLDLFHVARADRAHVAVLLRDDFLLCVVAFE